MDIPLFLSDLFGGAPFEEKADLTALRQFHVPNAYCCNAAGKVTGICATAIAVEAVEFPAMPSLEYLYVGDNEGLKSWAFEGALPALVHFDVSDSGLKGHLKLPDCPALEKLDASRNQLTKFSFQTACPSLTWLDLSGNENLQTLALPAGFRQLVHLHLRKCGLVQLLIRGSLPALQVLDLEENRLQQWPSNFKLPESLQTLYLNGNPLEDIPESIRGSGDRRNSCERVRRYLLSTTNDAETDYLHQAKLILVGNGEVGKSSVRIKLLDKTAPLPKQKDRTPGLEISVEPYFLKDLPSDLTGLDMPIDFQLNIWDFGGQSRYREVQQLFCTPKSLYVFVTACDDQPEQKDEYVSFEYWMSMVHALSYEPEKLQSSPVIHLVNKTDLARKDINQLQHNQLGNVARFLEVSCKTLYNFDLLEKAIREVLPRVGENMFRDRFSKSWLEVKDALQQRRGEHHISLREYVDNICAPELNEGDAVTWLDALHNIGAVIYFGENEKLKDWIILDPNWVTAAIFKVLDCGLPNPLSRNNFDRFIWGESYTPTERDKLLALMEAYGICYAQPDNFGQPEYVVPMLLSDAAANYEDKLPANLPSVHLRFQYAPFLPAGSVNKLMVRLKDYIFRNLMWKNHVILHHPHTETYAHVWEDWRAHCIYLQLYGQQPGLFYQELHAALEAINTNFKDTHFLKQLLDFKVEGKYKNRWREKELLAELGATEFAFLWLESPHRFGKDKEKPSTSTDMKTVQQLITKGDITGALKALEAQVPPRLTDEVVQLSARNNELERNNRKGILSYDKANVERNRIVNAILNLANEVDTTGGSPAPPAPQPPQEEEKTAPRSGKKQVLFICSSPKGKNLLDFGREFKKIDLALRLAEHRDTFEEPKIMTSVESDELLNILTKYKPDILHISLHSSKSEGLYFEDIAGNVQPMSVEDFADLIEMYCSDPDGKGQIETVVLSSCNSELYGEAIQSFSNNVVATKGFFPDEAAIVYADQFYKMLFNQKDVNFAHGSACLAIKRKKYVVELGLPVHEIPILIKNKP